MNNEIYKITNKINNKIYIGLTIQGVKVRFLHHLYEARSGSPFPIHRAIRKYGEENFELEIVKSIESSEELKELEKFYIKEFKANNRQFGYNMTEGGDGTFGRLHSEETKEKIRQKALGRKASEETKQRLKESANRIKEEDWYHDAKVRAGKATAEKTRRRIEVYDLQDNYITTYNSRDDASEATGVHKETILRCIKLNNDLPSRSRKYKYKYEIK